MSDSVVTPKENRTAYQRWELDSFDSPARGGRHAVLPTATQIEQMHQQAHDEGYAIGYREGGARAAAEAQRLQQLVAALSDATRTQDQQIADDLLDLALTIARQVLRQALKLRPELILAAINEVLAQMPLVQQRARLMLNPDDVTLVRLALGDRLKQSGWEIVESAQISRGGCRLESAECDVDATLEHRWQRVIDAVGMEHAWAE